MNTNNEKITSVEQDEEIDYYKVLVIDNPIDPKVAKDWSDRNMPNIYTGPVSDYAKNRNLPADMSDEELEHIAGSKAAIKQVGRITDYTLVPDGLLKLIMNCLERDIQEKPIRKEILEELQNKCIPFVEAKRYWTL